MIFLDIFSPALAMPGPIGEAVAALSVGPGFRRIGHDLDPEDPVREVAVVEREPEIAVATAAAAARHVIGVHARVEQVQILLFHSFCVCVWK